MQARTGRLTLGILVFATLLAAGACGSGDGGTIDPGPTLQDAVADTGSDAGAVADADVAVAEDAIAPADAEVTFPVDAIADADAGPTLVDVAADSGADPGMPADADVEAPVDADASAPSDADIVDAVDTGADADAGVDATISCANAGLACVHGACDDSLGLAVCRCQDLWTGSLCDACAQGHQDNDGDGVCAATCATAALECVNGACDDSTGIAVCKCADLWTGDLCDSCPDGFQDNDGDGTCAADCATAALACVNGACDDSTGIAVCKCADLWTGDLCDACGAGYQDNDGDGVCVGTCAIANPGCFHGTCSDDGGTPICLCTGNWTGALCSACIAGYQDYDLDGDCEPGCGVAELACAHGMCVDSSGAVSCRCSDLWTGALCDACEAGLQDNDGDGVCTPTCAATNPACVNGACDDSDGAAGCKCDGLWDGALCDVCAPGHQDNDGDKVCAPTCATANPACLHGACLDVGGTAACACEDLWAGDLCDSCADGFQDNDDDGACVPDCATADLACVNGACSDAGGTAACECEDLWVGDLCDSCADGFQDNDGDGACTATCAAAQPMCVNGACDDSSGTAGCACWALWAGTLCDACTPGYQDNDGDGECRQTCASAKPACAHGACADVSGTAVCACTGLWTGVLCDACPAGYQDNDGDGTCTPTCAASGLTCVHGTCVDTSGTEHCECAALWTGALCDACAEGYQDHDGDGVCTPTCATASLSCEPDEACGDGLGSAHCVPAWPATCRQSLDLAYAAVDGERTLFFASDPTKPWTAWCHGMATRVPVEYLTLPAGPAANYSRYGIGGYRTGALTTEFTKVRVDPITLIVDRGDYTYSTSTGPGVFSGGTLIITKLGYADAGDCVGAGANGLAGVDLTGTPFSIGSTFCPAGWYPTGWTEPASDYGQTVVLHGGGSCGDMLPCGGGGLQLVVASCPGHRAGATCSDCAPEYVGGDCGSCAPGFQDNDGDGNCSANCVTAALACAHGTCVDYTGIPVCQCSDRWTGALCDACQPGYAGPDCTSCAPGFQDNDGDKACEPTCAAAALSCVHGTCDDASGVARCVCANLWAGTRCDTCVGGYQDNDGNGTCSPNCTLAALACVFGACSDASGTAMCVCEPTWGGSLCNECADGFQDNDFDGTCKPTCATAKPACINGACTDAAGTAVCACADRWTGPLCDACIPGYQDRDGDGVCAPTCATANLVCGDSMVCADALGTAHCTHAWPSTCREAQEFSGRVADGPQTLYFGRSQAKPWTAWCRGLNAATPTEYLTLPAGSAKNYSTYMAYIFRKGTLTTYYSKVRIDPVTLLVDRGDTAFATSVGMIYDCCSYPPVALVGSLPWADAQGCVGTLSDDPATFGTANVDVSGTPFTVTSTFCLWGAYPKGYTVPASGFTQSFMMYGKGGCGGLAPCTGGLQLAYP